MLQPKRRKYAKDFRGKRRGVAIRGSSLSFGEYGLKTLDGGWLTAQQIEAGRRTITHALRKGGRVWVRVFPDKPVSARASGKRMGGGKGDVSHYVAVVLPGRILFEVAGASQDIVKDAMGKAAAKMPFRTKMVSKEI
jgi:large subunit ribosomal protein L16